MSLEQSRYQVRFDWGVAGAHAIADDADVLVWVDAIGSSLDPATLPATPALVEDQLAAGAIIDRLARSGLDATSPEAAAAEGAFLHLERAVGHLMTASVTAAGSAESFTPADFRVDEALTRGDAVVARELA